MALRSGWMAEWFARSSKLLLILRVNRTVRLVDLMETAGISIHHHFAPGDLGQLIYIHGVQNFADYGFNHVHEAYCAQIAVEFILCTEKGRSQVWLAKKEGKVVGSIFIVERPNNQAQLRLLFVDHSFRGVGLGRWLVEESSRYCRGEGFSVVYLWTVKGLDRAIWLYESVGFTPVSEKKVEEWGKSSLEIRFDLNLATPWPEVAKKA
jgi:GNAT superfamily N-acetyltransferase